MVRNKKKMYGDDDILSQRQIDHLTQQLFLIHFFLILFLNERLEGFMPL